MTKTIIIEEKKERKLEEEIKKLFPIKIFPMKKKKGIIIKLLKAKPNQLMIQIKKK